MLRRWVVVNALENVLYKLHTRRTERLLMALGVALLVFWAGARVHRAIASRIALAQFKAEEGHPQTGYLSPSVDPTLGTKVDFRLWSNNRIAGYKASLTEKKEKPIAILRIPKIALEVPVFDDTDELTLNRGVGRILGTARVGQNGNLGIAGHRDGFFRGLKDLAVGDLIELEAGGTTGQYAVKNIQVVKPQQTEVLTPTATRTVTLVTCFPFYYVGSAPERFIVTAEIQDSGQRD
jgi:sortase A